MNLGIIGGGLTGLTAAYELSKTRHEAAPFEKEAGLGGQAAIFQVTGEHLEGSITSIFPQSKTSSRILLFP